MDLAWIWKSILIVVGGTLLLRVAGRKSISQMTLAQTVIMVGIGSLLIQPLAGKNIWTTLAVGSILVITLIVMEYAQVKSDKIEQFITGKSKVLIENGEINEKNLKKMRFTVDQMEMKLRQQNVTSIEKVKWATLEPNGQVGFELKSDDQPATKKDIQSLQKDIEQIARALNVTIQKTPYPQDSNHHDIFSEVAKKEHNDEPPKHLQ
ncbi:DUF421 domain-containing protein [Sporosarcina pasteurii]|uniref:Protein of uncharacterized function (DUF421) n=1 Tax=Sporosarcina pasteurii TaxID=1474 RepID=A0A380C7S9_SPOPA|nr:DUF421 domain-containing protein [Sporosarcina pasteurii]MDS9472982.1 DUF421 domain-containing protein [Sporosarcina pasteurii]QBQ04498.1 DUF421 domain-containing protein [Sporosarcina pasteurii]SUJ14473.1 Protein of uncharacterised function (DUF421) [Sporosarcina pasteurii]